MYFSDKGCIRPLRHLYGYATGNTLLCDVSLCSRAVWCRRAQCCVCSVVTALTTAICLSLCSLVSAMTRTSSAAMPARRRAWWMRPGKLARWCNPCPRYTSCPHASCDLILTACLLCEDIDELELLSVISAIAAKIRQCENWVVFVCSQVKTSFTR